MKREEIVRLGFVLFFFCINEIIFTFQSFKMNWNKKKTFFFLSSHIHSINWNELEYQLLHVTPHWYIIRSKRPTNNSSCMEHRRLHRHWSETAWISERIAIRFVCRPRIVSRGSSEVPLFEVKSAFEWCSCCCYPSEWCWSTNWSVINWTIEHFLRTWHSHYFPLPLSSLFERKKEMFIRN